MIENDERNVIELGEIITIKRQIAQIVWTEIKFIDTGEKPRSAFERTCIGFKSNVQYLIIFDYWADSQESN